MKVFLIVANGKKKGLLIPVKEDLFMMGTDPTCQLKFKLPGVAPQHCALVTRDGKKVFVRDLEGGETYVNGELMGPGEEWPIHAGDRIAIAQLEFMFQFNERQLSQKDAEEWALKSLDKEAARKSEKEPTEDELNEMGIRVAPRPPENASAAAASLLDKLTAQRGVVKGRLRVSDNNGIKMLRFNDAYLVEESEINFIKRELMQHLEGVGPKRYLLDFKNVGRMSSAAGEMLKEVRRRVHMKGGSLALCRVRNELQMILETIGFIPEIPHFKSKDDALEKSW